MPPSSQAARSRSADVVPAVPVALLAGFRFGVREFVRGPVGDRRGERAEAVQVERAAERRRCACVPLPGFCESSGGAVVRADMRTAVPEGNQVGSEAIGLLGVRAGGSSVSGVGNVLPWRPRRGHGVSNPRRHSSVAHPRPDDFSVEPGGHRGPASGSGGARSGHAPVSTIFLPPARPVVTRVNASGPSLSGRGSGASSKVPAAACSASSTSCAALGST